MIAGIGWIVLGMFGVLQINMMKAMRTAGEWQQFLLERGGGVVRSYDLMMSREFMVSISIFGVVFFMAAFLLSRYNGERGKQSKWLFYVVYPLHFAVLIAVAWVIGLI